MRYIHPAAWAGLLLNGMLIFSLGSLDSLTPSSAPDIAPEVLDVLRMLQPAMYMLLFLQVLAIGLIALRHVAGLVLAVFAGVFLIPAGLVYILGCVLSHYRWKYALFASGAVYSRGARAAFRSSLAATLPIFAFAGFALGMLCYVSGLRDFVVLFFGLGLTGAYLSVRARKHHALSLHEDHFTVVPGLFVDPLAIPYSIVHEATLNDDESIRFTVELKPGQTVAFSWSLLRVEKKSRRDALESLGAALAAHNVPLY